MGYIADLSRYDPTEAVDQYDGVILNIEDPGFAAKRDRAIDQHIPWGTYSWIYPGAGADAAQRASDAGTGDLGIWFDYEQAGVVPADLTAALKKADQLKLKAGAYTYLATLDSVVSVIGDHPLWLAYYPGGSVWEPDYSDTARQHGALLHQFTSSNGTRDLSVVLDQPRWVAWTGTTPAPANPFLWEEPVHYETDPADRRYIWEFGTAGRRYISADEWAIIQSNAVLSGIAPPKPFAGTVETFKAPDVATFVGGSGGGGPRTLSGTFTGSAA